MEENNRAQVIVAGYPLEQLRDYAVRDRLLSGVFEQQRREGTPLSLASRFTVRFDNLIGLVIDKGPTSHRVGERFEALCDEFGYCRHFDTLLAELAPLFRKH